MSEYWERKSVREIDVTGKKVIVRVDFNVPLDENKNITNDNRIKQSLPTIEYLIQHKAKIILLSHLGRPKGKKNSDLSLCPVAQYLDKLLAQKVFFADDCIGEEAKSLAASLKEGEILLLENVRFYAEEEQNDADFAQKLAALADIYVNDAFGTAHRAHASTSGIAAFLPAVSGLLMEHELSRLGVALADPQHPFVAIIGGAKISDKIGVIESLLHKVDKLLIGGGMAYTFLAADDYHMQKSIVDESKLHWARNLMKLPEADKILLPIDLVAADELAPGANTKIVEVDSIPEGWEALDVGPATREAFEQIIKKAKTIVWNGPLGVFEIDDFAQGTLAIADAIARSDAYSIVGGGDSVAAIHKAKVEEHIDHISTGGGASLKFLEGQKLASVVALDCK
ncbi:MAG: phosphoglycerate kinase [Bacillota bacterium]|jgi:phosphoglycerate kinase